MTYGVTTFAPGNGAQSSFPLTTGRSDPDLAQIAGEIVGLASTDPADAATILREIFASTPASANAQIAGAVAANLSDQTLDALAQTNAGCAFLDALAQFAPADRVRDALGLDVSSIAASVNPFGDQYSKLVASQFHLFSGTSVSNDDAAKEQVKSAFKEEFAAKAGNKEEFDAFMHQVYRDKYDKNLAEQYRQMALRGDFSFLPEVRFVDAATLQGGKGAYNEAEGVVYINRDIAASDPAKAAQVFVEEAGAHLDSKLNTVDTQGDEGEMFRRVLSGEHLDAREIEAIRNDDDHGTITVDGKKVEVEFWFGEDFVDAVGDVASDVVDGAKEVGEGIVGAAKDVAQGIVEVTGGFIGNLLEGNIGEALSSVVRGVDRAVFQSTERFYMGVLKGAQKVCNGITKVLGPIGKPLRWATDRLFDIGQTALDTAYGMGRDAFRLIPDTFTGFVSDVERAVKLAAEGKWGDAFKQFGMSFVNLPGRVVGPIFDMSARFLQGAASAAQTAVGAEPPARGLTNAERKYLESIYGDSIDYDMIRVKEGGPLNDAMTAHTVGNTVYLPSKYFDNGKLTDAGLKTLGHEVGHVWQNQNGGGDYIHNALGSQLIAKITDGDRDAAYDWRKALRDGETFESMNDEERAKVMEDIGVALRNDGMITFSDGVRGADTADTSDDKPAYTPEELAFLRDTAQKIKYGEGAG